MCTKTASGCPDDPSAHQRDLCPLVGRFFSTAEGNESLHKAHLRKFQGGLGRGQRVGIDVEALFMHPPCSSKKSKFFPLVSLSLSLTRTPFAKWKYFFFKSFFRTHGRLAAAKPAGWGRREREGDGGSEVSLLLGLRAKVLLVLGATRLPHLRVLWHVSQRVGADDVPAEARRQKETRQGGMWALLTESD